MFAQVVWIEFIDARFCGMLKQIWNTFFQTFACAFLFCVSICEWLDNAILSNSCFLLAIGIRPSCQEHQLRHEFLSLQLTGTMTCVAALSRIHSFYERRIGLLTEFQPVVFRTIETHLYRSEKFSRAGYLALVRDGLGVWPGWTSCLLSPVLPRPLTVEEREAGGNQEGRASSPWKTWVSPTDHVLNVKVGGEEVFAAAQPKTCFTAFHCFRIQDSSHWERLSRVVRWI